MTDNDGAIACLALHPDRPIIIHGDINGKLYFRDAYSGQLSRKIKAHESAVHYLSFNSNGRLLLSATSDGEIKIFDFEKDAVIQSLYSPDFTGINFALFSIADGFIYFNSGKRIYKTRSDLTQRVNLILEENDTVSDAVISADRHSLVYAAGTTLKVMNTRSDELRQELITGASSLVKLKLLNDTTLATWSADGTLAYWKFQLGQIDDKPYFWMKAGLPGEMCFNHDGTLMVSGNVGNWARLWKTSTKEVAQELFGHKSTVTNATFGKSDALLFTGSKDGTIKIWKDPVKKISLPEPVIDKDTTFVSPTNEPILATDSSSNQIVIEKEKSDSIKTSNTPEVSKLEDNTPLLIGGRQVFQAGTIQISSPEVTIYVFDNSTIDGDTMSLYFNDEWILDHYGVTKSKKPIQLTFRENSNNYMVMFANNLGKTAPNTAAIQFFDGKSERYFRLSSDLSRCSSLNFIYKKP
ncbi:MAG: hypothetical protein RIQ47_919 [Bacteroidota bacterium]